MFWCWCAQLTFVRSTAILRPVQWHGLRRPKRFAASLLLDTENVFLTVCVCSEVRDDAGATQTRMRKVRQSTGKREHGCWEPIGTLFYRLSEIITVCTVTS